MASIRSKCTTNTINTNNNTNNLINNKSYAKNLNIFSGSNQNTPQNQQSSRPQLRWSQSFSPIDRQKPNVSTLIRRKSAVERLAESKYNYIKCSPKADKEVNDKHKYIQLSRSLSAGKTPLVILSQTLSPSSQPVLQSNQTNNQNSIAITCDQSLQPLSAQTTNNSTQVVTRKRNSSLSSRLSEGSNNLEIQLRQLIADNGDTNDKQFSTNNCNNNNKNLVKDLVIEKKSLNKTNETEVKPKPKERINTTNNTNSNQIIANQTFVTTNRNVLNKTNISNSFETNNKKTNNTNNSPKQLRTSSSHSTVNSKPIQPKPTAPALPARQPKTSPLTSRISANPTIPTAPVHQTQQQRVSPLTNRVNIIPTAPTQPVPQQKTSPLTSRTNISSAITTAPAQPIHQQKICSTVTRISSSATPTTPTNSRQLSISRSKSDVSNRLLVRYRSKSRDEIERFFETLGLDSTVWDSIRSEATNSLISTPNHYFDSCESFQSGAVRLVHMSSSSSESSTHSIDPKPQTNKQLPNQLNSRLMQSRSCHALSSGTSIVEKNARVIKWLYNCRKAMV